MTASAVLPQTVVGEQYVLGAACADLSTAAEVASWPRTTFLRGEHRDIQQAIGALVGEGAPVSFELVQERLSTDGHRHAASTLLTIETQFLAFDPGLYAYHRDQVRRSAIEREIHSTFREALQDPQNERAYEAAETLLMQRNALLQGRKERFRFIDDEAIEHLPKPVDHIEGLFPRGGLVVVFGPPGCGKSFVALDWALSTAAGVPWQGREAIHGPAVYVVAEGSAGMGARVRSWKLARMRAGERVGAHFLTEPVLLLERSEERAFLSTLQTLPEPPALIVVDTLARCFTGDENSTRDMSGFVSAADRLRRETGATVVIVHHTNANGERERGNTALRGACDTMISIRGEDDRVIVACEKQKDALAFEKLHLELRSFGESAAVITAKRAWQQSPDELTPIEAELLSSLPRDFLADGATTTQWLTASGVPERSFYRARTALVHKGYVNDTEGKRGAKHTVTAKGAAWFTANCQLTANSLPGRNGDLLPATGGGYRSPPAGSNAEHLEERYREEAERKGAQ